MSLKCLLALMLVAALVALASPYGIDDEFEEEAGGATEEQEADALQLFLQKRGRGSRYIRCFDEITGAPCKCDRSRARGAMGQCKK